MGESTSWRLWAESSLPRAVVSKGEEEEVSIMTVPEKKHYHQNGAGGEVDEL